MFKNNIFFNVAGILLLLVVISFLIYGSTVVCGWFGCYLQLQHVYEQKNAEDIQWLADNNNRAKIVFIHIDRPCIYTIIEGTKNKVKKTIIVSDRDITPVLGEVWEIGQEYESLFFIKKASENESK